MENRQNQAPNLFDVMGKIGRLYTARLLEAQKNFLGHLQQVAVDPKLSTGVPSENPWQTWASYVTDAAQRSVLFWDTVVLNGYLFLNLIIGWNVLEAERQGVHYQSWLKPLIYISIPWAVSIHTVTAYLYCGLPGRGFWLTAILAPRFLSSAFASGPALLILLCLVIRRVSNFDPGWKQIQSLAVTVAYAICINVFFLLCEVFVAFYSQIPEHMDHLKYLFVGLHGHGAYVPWMWASMTLMVIGIILLVNPVTRKTEGTLIVACLCVFFGCWIDKGMGMISGGFVPNPLHEVNEYIPTLLEGLITIGVYALGFFVLSILFKIAVSVKEEVRA